MSAAFRGQREEVEQMKSCLRVLSQPTPPTAGEAEMANDQQEREGALELLADLCENMDNAAGNPSSPTRACRLCPHLRQLSLVMSLDHAINPIWASSLPFQPPGARPCLDPIEPAWWWLLSTPCLTSPETSHSLLSAGHPLLLPRA